MDETVKANKLKNLDNYKREIDNITKFIESLKLKQDIFLRKVAVQEANFKLILEEFEYLKPSWKYESNPEYIANIKVLNEITMEENRIMWKEKILQMEQGLETSEQQIASLKEAVEKIEKELSEDDGQ
jgi:hypothetical protein